jgi:hypothetical protein
MTTKTITRERLAELRRLFDWEHLIYEPAGRELLDACEALLKENERMAGPVCTDTDCPDYDGEHPHHQNVLAVEFERGQKVGRETWWRAGFEACRERAAEAVVGHESLANAIRTLTPDCTHKRTMPHGTCEECEDPT